MDPQQPNCGTLNGEAYCNGETDKCGTVNGVFMCIPHSGSRDCTYANGEYVCIDPKTNTKISSSSPDHPDNGGNADGNPNNDPTANDNGTSSGTTTQGAGSGATNKSINDLKDALTDRLDGFADAMDLEGQLTGITQPGEQGTFDLAEWDEKIEAAKIELKGATNTLTQHFNAVNNWIINGSGGSLSCYVLDMARICIDDYADQLSGLRYVLIFLASIIAVYIVFLRD